MALGLGTMLGHKTWILPKGRPALDGRKGWVRELSAWEWSLQS